MRRCVLLVLLICDGLSLCGAASIKLHVCAAHAGVLLHFMHPLHCAYQECMLAPQRKVGVHEWHQHASAARQHHKRSPATPACVHLHDIIRVSHRLELTSDALCLKCHGLTSDHLFIPGQTFGQFLGLEQ